MVSNCPSFSYYTQDEGVEVTYDIVLVIVISELIFAFGVGLSCVVFSVNLVKAVRLEREDTTGDDNCHNRTSLVSGGGSEEVKREMSGDGNRGNSVACGDLDYNTFRYSEWTGSSEDRLDTGEDSDTEISSEPRTEGVDDDDVSNEGELSLFEGVLENFTEYLRVW